MAEAGEQPDTTTSERGRPRSGPSEGLFVFVGGLIVLVFGLAVTIANVGATTEITTQEHLIEPASGSPSDDATSVASSGSTASAGTTDTSGDPTARLQQFLDQLAAAQRSADVDALIATMHPAVLARFDEARCRAASQTADPTSAFSVVSVTGPADYAWTTADERGTQTTVVPDTYTVTVTRTANGQTTTTDVHVAEIDGRLSWFAACDARRG